MAAFIVATVSISDPDAFKAYAEIINGLSEQYGGKSILKGAVTEVFEGSVPSGQRVVVIEFPDAEAARNYINDPIYLQGKARREGAATVDMRLICVS